MSKQSLLVAIIALQACVGATRADPQPTLKVGDPAPKLYVSEWVKGKPVEQFEKEKVYIVECWATWCGPCNAAIPHVNQLARNYLDRGVTVIGLDVCESDSARVRQFVENKGDKMNYTVAIDDGDRSHTAWLKAAGREGIPCSFVVDQQGRIAWIGHPKFLDNVIEQVLAGTFDAAKFDALQDHLRTLEKQAMQSFAAKRWDDVLATCDQMVKLDPALDNLIAPLRLRALLGKKDSDAAHELIDKMLKFTQPAKWPLLWRIAASIAEAPDPQPRDLSRGLELAERAYALCKDQSPQRLLSQYSVQAQLHFKSGHIDRAIELQTQAIEQFEKLLQTDKRYAKYFDELKETLARYRAAKKTP